MMVAVAEVFWLRRSNRAIRSKDGTPFLTLEFPDPCIWLRSQRTMRDFENRAMRVNKSAARFTGLSSGAAHPIAAPCY